MEINHQELKNLSREELLNYIQNLSGVIWHTYKKQEDNTKTTLTHIPERDIITDNNKPMNYLIEGDNYDALRLMQKTYREKIDVIYIDPPYNTGNKDFVYNDRFVDKEDTWRHSKWLSFMSKRLKLARELLKDDGIIFISIDDNEQAQLKLLCDEVFGEKNFVSNIIWRKTGQQQNNGKNIANVTEYVLIYAKSLYDFNGKKKDVVAKESILERKGIKAYNKVDKKGRFRLNPIQDKSTGKHSYSILNPITNEVVSSDYWRISKEKYEELLTKDMIYWTDSLPNQKKYLDLNQGVLPSNFIDGIYNEESNKEIKEILGNGKFSYPKPVRLIKKIISMCSNKNAIILDFFAGSGTTGHAILDLNKEDGGNRQFILVTNNENNICTDVTYPRIQKVIEGYTTPKGKEVEGLGGNLKYYKIENLKEVY